MPYVLKQIVPSNSSRPIEINLTEHEVHVGRKKSLSLSKYQQMSREHAIFYKSDDGSLFVKDLNSLNGIFVNDIRIGESLKPLFVGDIIGFGVTSQSADEGFVCVLCIENETEIIDLTSDDMPDVVADSLRKLNSGLEASVGECITKSHIFLNCSDIVIEDCFSSRDESSSKSFVSDDAFFQRNIPENIPLKKCFIPLVRCDSEYFKWPPSVKNPFSTQSGYKSSHEEQAGELNLGSSVGDYESVSSGSLSYVNEIPCLEQSEKEKTVLNSHKKHVRKLSIDSVADNYEGLSPGSILKSRKKRVRKLSPCSSEESCEGKLLSGLSYNSDTIHSRNESYHTNIKQTEAREKLLQDYTFETLGVSDITSKKPDLGCNNSNYELENKTEKENYSQIEDIFYISGSRSYFKSTQNSVLEEVDNLNDVDDGKDVFERWVEREYVSSDVRSNSLVPQSQETESAMCIRAIVNNTKQNNSKLQQSDASKKSNSASTGLEFSPVPRQNLDCDEGNRLNTNPAFMYPGKLSVFNYVESQKNNTPDIKNKTLESSSSATIKITKSTVKTQLVEPETMLYHPRRLQDEKNKSVDVFTLSTKRKRGRPKKQPQFQDETINVVSSVQGIIASRREEEAYSTETCESVYFQSSSSSSAFFGKALLRDPKPMPRRRKFKGSDEELAKLMKSLNISVPVTKRKRGRPRKQTQLGIGAITAVSNVQTTIPHKDNEEHYTDEMHERLNLQNSSSNSQSSRKVLLTEPKPMTYRPRRLIGRDEAFVERKKSVDSCSIKKKKGRPKKQAECEYKAVDSDSKSQETNLCKFIGGNQTVQSRKSVKLPSSSINSVTPGSAKSFKKKGNSVKTRPDKFCSRMGFLINELKVSPQGRNTITKGGKSENACKAKKSDTQNSLENKNDVMEKNKLVLNKTAEKNIAPAKQIASSPKFHNTKTIIQKLGVPEQKQVTSTHINLRKEKKVEASDMTSEVACSSEKNFLQRTSSTKTDNSVTFDISFHGLVKSLIHLNTKWLPEQSERKMPPPAVMRGVAELPLTFVSFESYASSFYPFIMLEIWEYMYRESKEVYAGSKQNKKFYFSILSFVKKADGIVLKCESVVNENICFAPREGMMVTLELKKNSSPVFGYILKHRIDSLNLSSLKMCWKNLPAEWFQCANCWTFHVQIRSREMSFILESLMEGYGLCYIRNKLRLADALSLFKYSPLLTDILQPRISTFSVNYPVSFPAREYSSRQVEVIKGISAEINKPAVEPKIILLHGPPGSGKTHVIIGLLENLFYNSKCRSNLKILITAPSHVAIDEIGCRLIELNERFGWRNYSLKFVRIGFEKQVHFKMLPYFLDRKAKELFQQSLRSSKEKEKELQSSLTEISELSKEPSGTNKNERLNYLTEQCQVGTSATDMDYGTEMKLKTTLLKESHVILLTLNNCSLLRQSFKPLCSTNFSCCIIDESTHCTELEILQPLMFGISKLILVGDNKQLPATVLSKLSGQCGLDRSMFERFNSYFESTGKACPILTLTEQFRMHSSICEFPSKHSYGKKFFTDPSATVMYKEFPLNPYIVLNVSEKPESNASPGCDNETLTAFNICKFLSHVVASTSSIAIIVPHESQVPVYTKTLHAGSFFKDIEICTLNWFQGREKDIVVLLAFKPNNHSCSSSFIACKRRLNVALTRARKCLIICVHSTPLMQHTHWKALICNAQERKVFFTVKSADDIASVLQDYAKKKI